MILLQPCKYYRVDSQPTRVGEWIDAEIGTLMRVDFFEGGYSALILDRLGTFVVTPIAFVKTEGKPLEEAVSNLLESVIAISSQYVSKEQLEAFKNDIIKLKTT